MSAFFRYLRSPASIVGLVLLLAVIAMALSAPFVFPNDQIGRAHV